MQVEIKSYADFRRGAATMLIIAPPGVSYQGKFGALEENYNFLELVYDLKESKQVLEYANRVIELLEEKKIKSVSLIGLDQGGALAQAIAVRTWRILRRLVLLDSYTRLSPTFIEKIINRIESFLPLGLPLRKLDDLYDSRCELHRIHCPTLILRNMNFNLHLDYQAMILNKCIPNSWYKKIKSRQQLIEMLCDFEQVPAKRPQK